MGDVTIRIAGETADRLRNAAEAAGVSMDEIARQAILERIEEMEDAPVVHTRLGELQDGSVKAIPHADVIRGLGLAD